MSVISGMGCLMLPRVVTPDLDDPLLGAISVVPVKEELEDLDRIDDALDDLLGSG